MTCAQSIDHPRVIFRQQALPWWVGHNIRTTALNAKTYDELKGIDTIPKSKLISIITSSKTFTRGHADRLVFVQRLAQELGDTIDVFGIDKQVDDKWDAIAPYKYHIVIENAVVEDYWTEKLADAFLGLSLPIYHGAPNISKYFSPDSLVQIDITKPDEAIASIKQIIVSDRYQETLGALRTAKELVLDQYQLFPMLAKYANEHIDASPTEVTLAPESESSIVKGSKQIWRKIKSLFLPKS
jgi:hypothetical protein